MSPARCEELVPFVTEADMVEYELCRARQRLEAVGISDLLSSGRRLADEASERAGYAGFDGEWGALTQQVLQGDWGTGGWVGRGG